jgi:hypothetical protein
MTKHLVEMFGYSGVSSDVDELLTTQYNESKYPTMSGGATTLLELISNNKRLHTINTDVTQQEFNKALRKWSEGTSTSPSGRHLGHYRCLFEDYDEDNKDPNKSILGVYYAVATSALNWGISLERWKTSITAMIEKQPGCPRINKLRVIHIQSRL